MKIVELQNISIAGYSKMLRSGADKEQISLIDAELSKSWGGLGDVLDLNLFMLQKDLLIFQCKFEFAVLDSDDAKIELYQKKIKELRVEVERKLKKVENPNLYKSFLAWILAVEKYLCFAIDKNNDLLYFAEATKQMLNHYEAQERQYEENKIKSGRK